MAITGHFFNFLIAHIRHHLLLSGKFESRKEETSSLLSVGGYEFSCLFPSVPIVFPSFAHLCPMFFLFPRADVRSPAHPPASALEAPHRSGAPPKRDHPAAGPRSSTYHVNNMYIICESPPGKFWIVLVYWCILYSCQMMPITAI